MKKTVTTLTCFLLVWSVLEASAAVFEEKPGTPPGKERGEGGKTHGLASECSP